MEDRSYGKFSREEIEEAVEFVFNNPREIKPEERQLKILRACDTYGMYKFGEHCGNEKCEPCNRSMEEFTELFKEEVQRQIDEYRK